MKKTLTAFFLVITVSVSYVKAQTSAGAMMIGGGFTITSQSYEGDDDYENSSVNFSPNFGYFISDNFAIGLNFGIGSSTTDNGPTKTKQSTFSFGPYARYYKFTSSENFAFFGQASLAFGTLKVDQTPGGESKGSSVSFALSPGFAYFFNNHWALDLAFQGFQITSTDPNKDNDDDKSTSISFGTNSFNPTLGVRYFFGN